MAQLRHIAATIIALLLLAGRAPAANLYQEGAFFHLEGQIADGDYQKLLALIRKDPEEFLRHDWQVNSAGGDAVEAMKIGVLFKELFLTVNVADDKTHNARCASACFFIFVGAVRRNAVGGTVGIHRPYFPQSYFANLSPDDAERKSEQLTRFARNFLTRNGVPDAIVARTFSLPADEVYWLDGKDLDNLGDAPPWFDQYVQSTCGFSSRMLRSAVERHDLANAKAWTACQSDIMYSQGAEAMGRYIQGK
jgi:hypothetical protein